MSCPHAGLAGVGQAGLLLHRQRVEVGAQHDRRPRPVAQYADHAGAAHPLGDLVAQRPQCLREDPGGPRLLERQLRVLMQVAVEVRELLPDRGQTFDRRHVRHSTVGARSRRLEPAVR
jgi:hypothetical protein